jgi:hypothetical protein
MISSGGTEVEEKLSDINRDCAHEILPLEMGRATDALKRSYPYCEAPTSITTD